MLKNVKIFLDKINRLFYNSKSGLPGEQAGEKIMMMNSGLMTIEDLADYLKVTRRTIYDWLKHNKIPALKLVGQWRFKKDKIDEWLTQHEMNEGAN
jgi:excisionase family DNA binding protein